MRPARATMLWSAHALAATSGLSEPMATISRPAYVKLFGPTKGDLVRLGDTSLLAEIEQDFTIYGHELLIGAGKTFRDGEGYCATAKYSDGALDFVIQNATIIDAEAGIIKGDIGI